MIARLLSAYCFDLAFQIGFGLLVLCSSYVRPSYPNEVGFLGLSVRTLDLPHVEIRLSLDVCLCMHVLRPFSANV
jgi:hypothetical protein